MNKKIKDTAHIAHWDMEIFYQLVAKNINLIQKEGLEVEVQYSSTSTLDKVVYSAYLIGIAYS